MKKYILITFILISFTSINAQEYKYWHDEPELRFIHQSKTNICWAACYTMMYNWKNGTDYSIDELLDKLSDKKYYQMYTDNEVLPFVDFGNFAKVTGLKTEPSMCYEVKGWYDLLEKYGPLMVVIDLNEDNPGTIGHAEIIYGMKSLDGTSGATGFSVMDPMWTNEKDESFKLFLKRYESATRKNPKIVQIFHWSQKEDIN